MKLAVELDVDENDMPLVVKWKLLLDEMAKKEEKGDDASGCGYSF